MSAQQVQPICGLVAAEVPPTYPLVLHPGCCRPGYVGNFLPLTLRRRSPFAARCFRCPDPERTPEVTLLVASPVGAGVGKHVNQVRPGPSWGSSGPFAGLLPCPRGPAALPSGGSRSGPLRSPGPGLRQRRPHPQDLVLAVALCFCARRRMTPLPTLHSGRPGGSGDAPRSAPPAWTRARAGTLRRGCPRLWVPGARLGLLGATAACVAATLPASAPPRDPVPRPPPPHPPPGQARTRPSGPNRNHETLRVRPTFTTKPFLLLLLSFSVRPGRGGRPGAGAGAGAGT